MKFTRRSILLVIAVICFVLAGLGVGIGGINLVAIGLAAFAGAFIFDEGRLKIG